MNNQEQYLSDYCFVGKWSLFRWQSEFAHSLCYGAAEAHCNKDKQGSGIRVNSLRYHDIMYEYENIVSYE